MSGLFTDAGEPSPDALPRPVVDVRPISHARAADPATSREAAQRVNITEQAARILDAYRAGPVIDEAAYARARFPPEARDGQRCSDLRQAGLIARTGERAKTSSGRKAYVCALTEAGREALRVDSHTERW